MTTWGLPWSSSSYMEMVSICFLFVPFTVALRHPAVLINATRRVCEIMQRRNPPLPSNPDGDWTTHDHVRSSAGGRHWGLRLRSSDHSVLPSRRRECRSLSGNSFWDDNWRWALLRILHQFRLVSFYLLHIFNYNSHESIINIGFFIGVIIFFRNGLSIHSKQNCFYPRTKWWVFYSISFLLNAWINSIYKQ